eukprot:CAMPEP_0177399622 /NCGR_PEP_ID=MMETSP0368-20130122/58584_1 /TAXON_ID=447022 ORGANISM="Scrippsiella hangoei-like, Strain SHHI-4" /NCGR_SAMPLE_ID=MMETSP0368 /ASSEMBLY_ACC=CAM_ASM_000363 /LENGTH=92 /DNA_ID=CAMNT_0018866887 /DNA_START=302 /DNA_END=576 /DNA_ORIENTATION=-
MHASAPRLTASPHRLLREALPRRRCARRGRRHGAELAPLLLRVHLEVASDTVQTRAAPATALRGGNPVGERGVDGRRRRAGAETLEVQMQAG